MAGAPVTQGGRLLAACEARGWRLRIDHQGDLVVEGRGRPDPDLMEALGDAKADVIGALLVRGMRKGTGPATGREQAHEGRVERLATTLHDGVA